MSMENQKAEKGTMENIYKPLEVPDVVPSAAPVDFPEISEFLSNMKIKGSLFGFSKEDVYEKMQELNRLYQSRVQQMRDQNRGQIRQIKKQQQEELEEIRGKLKEEQEAEREQELAKLRQEMAEQYRREREDSRHELELIQKEMGRLTERLTELKNKVSAMAEEEEGFRAE